MEQVETATGVKTVTPQELSTRMGINSKRVRQILRAEYPRNAKKRKWEIPETIDKKITKVYKAKLRDREAKKPAEIEKELEGRA